MAKYQTDTGLELDDADPDDAKILARQRAVAKGQGQAGADRTASTRGRADLESAYDEGATESAAPSPEGTGGGGTSAAPARPAKGPKGPKGPKGTKGSKGGFGGLQGSVPTPTLKPPRSLKSKDVSGFMLGLVIHALVVSYLRYGREGPTGWLKAKFLNDPIGEDDLKRENSGGGSRHEDPDSVPWEEWTPEERENLA